MVGKTYVGNDCVASILGNEVLHLAGRGILQLVATDEVVCEVELIGVRIRTVGRCFPHYCGLRVLYL